MSPTFHIPNSPLLTPFGARYYQSTHSFWLSVDPLADKYPNLSPYAYCGNNPVRLVDEDGRDVHPAGEEEYLMILNTLTEEDRQFVKLDSQGNVDKELMNSHQSTSGNYNSLAILVNSDIMTDVILEDAQYPYLGPNGEQGMQLATYQAPWVYSQYDKEGNSISYVSSGEGGNMGLTLFPGYGLAMNSTDQNIKIYVNKRLSPAGRAETFSHEGYGHALLYNMNGYDACGAGHNFGTYMDDRNEPLVHLILSAKKETIKNMAR